jgi:ribonuclease BN (tRNA processing enzyme)
MSVTIRVLGSGDAFGSGGRLQPCILVSGRGNFLIDCGASALIALNQYGIDPDGIDTILLSHLHGDHAGGIPFFVLDGQLIRKRLRPLTIAGPRGTADWYPRIMETMFPGSTAVERKFPVTVKELDPGKPETINGIRVESFLVPHGTNMISLALRIGFQEKTVAYSGDTEWTDSLLAVADGADIFITEAYSFDKKIKNHLNYSTLKYHWHELNVRRIVLTHMSNDMLNKIHCIDVETASDGKIIEI